MTSKIERLCEDVVAARETYDALKRQLVASKSEVALAEASLSAALLAKGGKYTHAGFSFSISTKVTWRMVKESKARLVQIIKGGAPELVKESVRASSLSAFLRKNEAALEKTRAGWWTEAKALIERSERPGLSVRKADANNT